MLQVYGKDICQVSYSGVTIASTVCRTAISTVCSETTVHLGHGRPWTAVFVFHYYHNTRDNFPSAESRSQDIVIEFSAPTYIKILQIDVKLSGEDVTGAVEGGQIDLRGSLFPVYRSVAFGYRLNIEAPPANDQNGRVSWDLDDPDAHGFENDEAIRLDALKPS